MVAYVKTKQGMNIWVSRRAAHLYTYPGMLDVTVAGGMKAGASPLETIIEELKLSTNKTRQLLQGTDWDDVSKRANGEGNRFSYRWVALHLIEEWGRHLGHADLLRENIDGETGD